MPHSNALKEFQSSLEMVEALLELERKYKNPPRKEEQKAVQALRGSAIVLMVASFEYFLRQVMEERLTELATPHSKVQFNKLPDKMQVCSIFNTLERAMKGEPFKEPTQKINRLTDIELACKIVVLKNVHPPAFNDSGSNPSPDTVSNMFSNVGLSDIFTKIKPKFDIKWGKATAHTFIRDKLQALVGSRHIVAHTANVLNISRSDLKEYKKFISICAYLLDLELETHIKHLLKTCV